MRSAQMKHFHNHPQLFSTDYSSPSKIREALTCQLYCFASYCAWVAKANRRSGLLRNSTKASTQPSICPGGSNTAFVGESTSRSTGKSLDRIARPQAMYSNIFIGLRKRAMSPPEDASTRCWYGIKSTSQAA